jgi:hypothetical protein
LPDGVDRRRPGSRRRGDAGRLDGRPLPGSRAERAAVSSGRSKLTKIGGVVMAIAALAGGRLVYRTFLAPAQGSGVPPGVVEGSPEHLRHVADEINASLPKNVDSDTRLTRVTAQGREFIYEIELVNLSSRGVDGDAFIAEAGPLLRRQLCGTPAMTVFGKHGITATFQVSGNDRVVIGRIPVSSGDCGP